MSDRIQALAFNELSAALTLFVEEHVLLSVRERIARRLVAVVGQEVRREIGESLRRAAAGRREYAERIPEHKPGETSPNPSLAAMKETLFAEASCYESAALIVEDPHHVMGAVPSWRWTDEEVASLYPPKEATDG